MNDTEATTFASPGAAEAVFHIHGGFDRDVNSEDERIGFRRAEAANEQETPPASPSGQATR